MSWRHFEVAGVTQESDVRLSISPLAIQTSAIRHQWNLSKCMLCHPPLKHFDTFTRYCQKHFLKALDFRYNFKTSCNNK